MGSLLGCVSVLNGYALKSNLESFAYELDRYILPITQSATDTYLEFFQAVDNSHKLYEHYFPDEFARSTKSIVPALDEAYSEREGEFFDLVDTHFVPMPWFLEIVGREERMYDLPIIALGREWWNGEELDEWEIGWLLLLWLIDEREGENELRGRFPGVAEALLSLPLKKGDLAFSALEQHCRQTKTPLAYLPEALNILYHDTGSWYLDTYTEEASDYIPFSQEGMDRAIVHKRRADRILKRADRFIAWIDADPIPRFKEVLTIWNLYCLEKQNPRT